MESFFWFDEYFNADRDRYYRSTADGTEGSLIHPVGACSRARVRCYALAFENNRFVA